MGRAHIEHEFSVDVNPNVIITVEGEDLATLVAEEVTGFRGEVIVTHDASDVRDLSPFGTRLVGIGVCTLIVLFPDASRTFSSGQTPIGPQVTEFRRMRPGVVVQREPTAGEARGWGRRNSGFVVGGQPDIVNVVVKGASVAGRKLVGVGRTGQGCKLKEPNALGAKLGVGIPLLEACCALDDLHALVVDARRICRASAAGINRVVGGRREPRQDTSTVPIRITAGAGETSRARRVGGGFAVRIQIRLGEA